MIKLLPDVVADVANTVTSDQREQHVAYRPLWTAEKKSKTLNNYSFGGVSTVVDERNRDGNTPLHVAGDSNRTPEVVEAFAAVGADFARDKDGYSPLRLASFNSVPELVVTFNKHGSEVNAADENGQTPLRFAAMGNGGPAMVTKLVEVGTEPDAKHGSVRLPYV